jgi:hypothetical protein
MYVSHANVYGAVALKVVEELVIAVCLNPRNQSNELYVAGPRVVEVLEVIVTIPFVEVSDTWVAGDIAASWVLILAAISDR